jgi:hypothetical protein
MLGLGQLVTSPLYLQDRAYEITETIKVGPVSGLKIIGAGGGMGMDTGTRLIWKGPPDVPMFDLEACRECYFSDLTIHAVNPLLAGVRSRSLERTAFMLSTKNIFERVNVVSSSGQLEYGYILDDPNQIDANNDAFVWNDCHVTNFKRVGWDIRHGQSMSHRLTRCAALYGWERDENGKNVSIGYRGYGSFAVNGWNSGGVGVIFGDISPSDYTVIKDVNSEDTGQLMFIARGGASWPILIDGVRFSQSDAMAPYNDAIVDLQCGGPIRIHNVIASDRPRNSYFKLWGTSNSIGNNAVSAEISGNTILTLHPTGLEIGGSEANVDVRMYNNIRRSVDPTTTNNSFLPERNSGESEDVDVDAAVSDALQKAADSLK